MERPQECYKQIIIIREEFRPNQTQQEVLNNLEQIKFLFWHGKYGQNGKKTGYWYASWNGSVLNSVGGYYKEGQKHGRWNQLSQNYHNSNKVYEIGEYCYNRKIGHWKYLFNDNLIGGGQYDEGCFEFKVGKWIELDDGYNQQKQVTYDGEYINCKKVGIWNIWFDQHGIKNNMQLQIQKIKLLVVLGFMTMELEMAIVLSLVMDLNFSLKQSIKDYIKMGKELVDGILSIWINKLVVDYMFKKGKELKLVNGLILAMDLNWILKQLTLENTINKGKKLVNGRLNQMGQMILMKKITMIFKAEIQQCKYQIQGPKNSGGGLYDQEGQGVKIGKWIDIVNGIEYGSQVIYNGQYQNGKKIGRWVIYQKSVSMQGKYQEIGGGLYDQEGQGVKIGKWIDISDGFKLNSQVIYVGGYKYGKKVGRWEIQCRKSKETEFKKIGVGQYDEVGQEVKIGQWIDIDGNYSDNSLVTYHGEYKNGIKVGRWDFWFNYNDLAEERKKIGGGSYDESDQGVKTGHWIDISEEFANSFQLTQNGEYKQGKKVSKWDIWFKEETDKRGFFFMDLNFKNIDFKIDRNKKENKIIGGGQYDKQNQGFKVGLWIDLSDQFKKYEQVLYKGEYINGKKSGVWKVLKKDQKENDDEFKLDKEIQYDN
ncbi:unnamed protein product [Paramecium pentaurelia]|uniref:Uncharacterized protein n=1 Tax=Paramecium pentaurelia TaxID=43138 RepID=A0A8S1YCH7_9CILI|nr:unnamed protein product [Paramecium pentaurelia]